MGGIFVIIAILQPILKVEKPTKKAPKKNIFKNPTGQFTTSTDVIFMLLIVIVYHYLINQQLTIISDIFLCWFLFL